MLTFEQWFLVEKPIKAGVEKARAAKGIPNTISLSCDSFSVRGEKLCEKYLCQ